MERERGEKGEKGKRGEEREERREKGESEEAEVKQRRRSCAGRKLHFFFTAGVLVNLLSARTQRL